MPIPLLNEVKITIKDLISEKDYDRNKAGIVSQVVGETITVDYKAGVNCAYKNKKGYTVIKASPKAKGIDGNTAINHELAHILFNSFENKVIRTLNRWTSNWVLGDSAYNTQRRRNIFNTYHEALNVIEDQRIESLWGRLYLGNVKEFVRTRKRLGKDLKANEHPSNMLLAERFFRPDLVQGKYAHVGKMIHDVEGKDLKASLVVLKKIKPYLDEIIKKLIDNTDKVNSLRGDLIKERGKNTPESDDTIKNIIEDRNLAEQEIRKASPVSQDQHRDDTLRCPKDKVYENSKGEEDKSIFEDDSLGEDTLDELKKSADNRIREIQDKMSGSSQMPKGKTYINYQKIRKDSEPNKITTDNKTVKQIQRLLRSFKERRKDLITSDGDELDVGSYIDMKANGYGDCMLDNTRANGLSICVSIDASGSMSPHNSTVERIMSTLWKSIEGTTNIDLKCITWHSDHGGNMSVRVYNKKDIGYLSKQVGGYTPTHFGIQVGSDELAKMKGERKLLIVITDGYPNYYKNGTRVRSDATGKEAIKAYKLATKRNSNVVILGIGYYLNHMKNMFGNKFITCRGMSDVEQFMMKTFRKEIIEVMKK
jgi:Mg-chelatase subunit ChlD